MEEDYYDKCYKVIFIGDTSVGKTNILSQYIKKKFEKDSKPTVGVNFRTIILKIEGYSYKLQIWDLAGQQRYKSIVKAYYKGAKCAFVVYDITQKSTFDNIDNWIKGLMSQLGNNVNIIILGNKCDLENERQITKEQGEEKAKEYNAGFFEVSALSGKNIDNAFETLISKTIQKEKEKINFVENEKKLEENLYNEEEKQLKDDLDYYKKENEKLKKENKKLNEDNENLKNELIKANKIISYYNNKPKEKTELQEIINLKNILLNKENEILNLKLKMQSSGEIKKTVNFDDILFIHFISLDQKINCPIKCLKTDTFAEVEEKLYQKYEEYRETNNNFVAKEKVILRFKKICDNNINDGDKIELIKIE